MQNGITGNGSSGELGSLVGLGLSLGTMGTVVGMAKDALNPVMEDATKMGQSIGSTVSGGTTWDCKCGNKGITLPFCGQCGAKKPEPKQEDTWDCECGNKGITMKFCGQCGAVRPEPKPATWDCTCGQKAIETGFCPNCGNKKE